MMNSMRKNFLLSLMKAARVVGFTLVVLASGGCAAMMDSLVNGTILEPPYEVDEKAEQFHRTLFIADLHADTMLWDRDLLVRGTRGHVDLLRLREGNVGLQVFGVVTKVPLFLGMENNSDSPDAITALVWFQDMPKEDRATLIGRALYQSKKLKDRIEKSKGAMRLILGQQDLRELVAARGRGEPVIGAMLSLEGVHALEGDLANLDRLYDAGFRLIGLNHLFDNEFAGSVHGKEMGGLSELGKELIKRAMARGMVIDIAHTSLQAFAETMAIVNRPVISSHGGVRATCDSVRNLTDDQIRSIAATGGVIAIGLFKYATCGKTIEHTVRAMRHVADLVGIQHVALGSDWDGSTAVIDASGLALVTEALLKDGFSRDDVAAIMGGNVLRVFQAVLPDNEETGKRRAHKKK